VSPLRPISLDSRSCAYPLCPDEAELGKTYCRHHKNGAQRWPWDDAGQVDPDTAPRATRAPTRARLNDEQLRDLHRRYRDEHAGANRIAADVWQAAGYPTQSACAQALTAGWHRLGLPVRPPGRIHR
jgi:hypothetical protein